MRKNTIVCGDTEYQIDSAYREGAMAMRAGISWSMGNPYRHGCYQHEQWGAGHTHEADGEHDRSGIDVIEALPVGCRFEKPNALPELPSYLPGGIVSSLAKARSLESSQAV